MSLYLKHKYELVGSLRSELGAVEESENIKSWKVIRDRAIDC